MAGAGVPSPRHAISNAVWRFEPAGECMKALERARLATVWKEPAAWRMGCRLVGTSSPVGESLSRRVREALAALRRDAGGWNNGVQRDLCSAASVSTHPIGCPETSRDGSSTFFVGPGVERPPFGGAVCISRSATCGSGTGLARRFGFGATVRWSGRLALSGHL
jgi:hypothetical protein